MAKQVTYTRNRVLRLDPETDQAIEDYRFSARHKTEADAIRELLRLGLQAAKAVKRAPKP